MFDAWSEISAFGLRRAFQFEILAVCYRITSGVFSLQLLEFTFVCNYGNKIIVYIFRHFEK